MCVNLSKYVHFNFTVLEIRMQSHRIYHVFAYVLASKALSSPSATRNNDH